MNTLPPPGTKRWVASRKAAVVRAIRAKTLTMVDACERYSLSIDELMQWIRAAERHGEPGLRATKFQAYRHLEAEIAR